MLRRLSHDPHCSAISDDQLVEAMQKKRRNCCDAINLINVRVEHVDFD